MPSNLTRTVCPRLQVLALGLRDMIELIGIRAEDVRRAQDVRQVVVESQVIVDDAVVNVIGFQEVLQRPRPLLGLGLDFMCFDFGQLDAAGAVGPASEVGQGRPPDLQHTVHSEMDLDIGDRRMSIFLGKLKCGDGRVQGVRDAIVVASATRVTCPASKRQSLW